MSLKKASQHPVIDEEELQGILPAQEIHELIRLGRILSPEHWDPDQVQPASMDLRLGRTAFRLKASFLPGAGKTVNERLRDLCLHSFEIGDGAVLEPGAVYLIPLLESLYLPDWLSAAANPKSSTGRIDVFTRLITDYGAEFDNVRAGYHGPLFLEVSPKTFPILVRTGSRLSQIRFRAGDASWSDREMAELHSTTALVDGPLDLSGGVGVSVDLSGGDDGVIGFRAKRHSGIIDVDRKTAYAVEDFWEPIKRRRKEGLILDPDEFYILASREAICVPPTHAAEMVPFSAATGEFRVHYAGFFDPGFGMEQAGGAGSRAVLEVRSHDVPFVLEDGQIVGRLIYERLSSRPLILYGNSLGSSYQKQGLKLSKHFHAV